MLQVGYHVNLLLGHQKQAAFYLATLQRNFRGFMRRNHECSV